MQPVSDTQNGYQHMTHECDHIPRLCYDESMHCQQHRHYTVAALIIEPLGSIMCGRNKPEIAERSQVFSPKMIDPSGSLISGATVCSRRALTPAKYCPRHPWCCPVSGLLSFRAAQLRLQGHVHVVPSLFKTVKHSMESMESDQRQLTDYSADRESRRKNEKSGTAHA
jgi:hypothetical protein